MPAPVYLDYAASTPLSPEVVAAMTEALEAPGLVANPSGSHPAGEAAFAAVERARGQVAALINVAPGDIVFTSGATESDNLAIVGAARFLESRGRHLVTALTEHKAVLESCRHLASRGWRVTWLKPDADGLIAPAAVAAALQPDTVLVSLMHANNETGVVLDVAAIGQICRRHDVLLHVDAAQSAGRVPLDPRAMHIDLLSLSAHKLYGPKGIGALYLNRERVRRVEPLLFGGGQERGLRPGTLPTHQVLGMGVAFAVARSRIAAEYAHATGLRQQLWALLRAIPGVLLNGHPDRHSGHILNVSVEGVEGESLHAALRDLTVASGSACTSLTDEPSYVLRALGRSSALARSSVRFSFGRFTSSADISVAAGRFREAVEGLRRRGPRASLAAQAGDTLVRGEAGSEEAGTRVVVQGRVAAGRLAGLDIGVYGCPDTMAACDLAVRLLRGGPVQALSTLETDDLRDPLAIPAEKTGRLLIIQDALRNCFADWDNRRLQSSSQLADS